MMRDTIFISHATPDDNEFSIWLASRLELMGYKVWIDKNELLGGEKFWEKIDLVIRNESVKFLLVYSEKILLNGQAGKLKDGVYKEFSLAESIAKQHFELTDFITLLKIDHSAHNLFIGADRLNKISFTDNWGKGLELLFDKLNKDGIKTNQHDKQTDFSKWYLSNLAVKNPIIPKKELFYTNWWGVDSFPETFYISRFVNETQAKTVFDQNQTYPISLIGNCISSFERKLNFIVVRESVSIEVLPEEIYTINTSDLLMGFDKQSFPTHKDASNHFKKLFKRAFHIFLKQKHLYWYELANKSIAYYHTFQSLPNTKVSFFYPFSSAKRPKKKNLFGKYLTLGRWHFAISVRPILEPILGFSVKSHIVFTKDGFNAWEDKDVVHSHRRKKGKRMFNEEWRDLLIGFINSLKNENELIEISIAQASVIKMKNNVELFWSEVGYYDPDDSTRQEIFIEEEEEEVEEKLDDEIVIEEKII